MTCVRLLIVTAACFLLTTDAHAAAIQLTQGGWQFGGPLTLAFTGQDSNVDGVIDQGELTAFSAVYQLPGGGSTSWSLGDIEPDGFSFTGLGDYLVFATNSSYTLIDSAFEGTASGSVVDAFLFPVDVTEDLPTAAAVPEPSTLGLFAAATIVFAAARKWRKVH